MSISTGESLQTFLPLYDVVPDKWEDARPFLVEALKRISYAVNVREIGSFVEEEVLTGIQFIPGVNATPEEVPNEFRDVLRIVIDCGALPNATTLTIPHGINYDANFSLVNLYLSATDPIGLTSFSVQYWSIAGGDITVSLDATNVIITTGSDYSAYTTSYAIIEYMLNV